MQSWPQGCAFATLRERLTRPDIGCSCEVAFSPGAIKDPGGHDSPAIYAFLRGNGPERRFATIVAYDEYEIIPPTEIRSLCRALDLDGDVLFGLRH